jgi:hypothetical protein
MDRPQGGDNGGDRARADFPQGNYPPPQGGNMPPPQGGYPPPPPNYQGGPGPGYGGYGRPAPPGPPPENNLVMAILSIFCCWPLGIPAIIFATQVQGKWAMGDIAGAQDSAQKARTFSMIAIILGIAAIILYLILFFVVGVSIFSFGTAINTTIPNR